MPECSIEIQGNMSKLSKPSTLTENSKNSRDYDENFRYYSRKKISAISVLDIIPEIVLDITLSYYSAPLIYDNLTQNQNPKS